MLLVLPVAVVASWIQRGRGRREDNLTINRFLGPQLNTFFLRPGTLEWQPRVAFLI